jgi:hypothetical protein
MRIFQPVPDQIPQAAEPPARHNRFSVNRTAGSMPVFKAQSPGTLSFNAQDPLPKVETGQKPSFADLIDIVNPLQHIPVVNTIYRHMTGDQISAPAQFMGATLYGGPLGGALSLANIAVEDYTGRGIGDTVMGFNDRPENAPVTLVSKRKPEAPRMAGTIPVWHKVDDRTPITPAKGDFTMLLNTLSKDNPKIS